MSNIQKVLKDDLMACGSLKRLPTYIGLARLGLSVVKPRLGSTALFETMTAGSPRLHPMGIDEFPSVVSRPDSTLKLERRRLASLEISSFVSWLRPRPDYRVKSTHVQFTVTLLDDLLRETLDRQQKYDREGPCE